MGTKVLVCVPTADETIQNPPCEPGSALTVVESSVIQQASPVEFGMGMGFSMFLIMVAYFFGRAVHAVGRI